MQVQEAHITNMFNQRNFWPDTLFLLLKILKIQKYSQDKEQIIFRGFPIGLTVGSSLESLQARRESRDTIQI